MSTGVLINSAVPIYVCFQPYVFGSVLAYSECYKVVMMHGKVHNYQWAAEYAEIPHVFPNDIEYHFSDGSFYHGH